MSVFVIVQGNPRDGAAEALQQYGQAATAIVARHGGQVVARGKGVGSLAGTRRWQVGLLVRFPDKAAVDAWHEDPEYRRVIPLRNEGYQDLEISVFEE